MYEIIELPQNNTINSISEDITNCVFLLGHNRQISPAYCETLLYISPHLIPTKALRVIIKVWMGYSRY